MSPTGTAKYAIPEYRYDAFTFSLCTWMANMATALGHRDSRWLRPGGEWETRTTYEYNPVMETMIDAAIQNQLIHKMRLCERPQNPKTN